MIKLIMSTQSFGRDVSIKAEKISLEPPTDCEDLNYSLIKGRNGRWLFRNMFPAQLIAVCRRAVQDQGPV